MPSFPFFRRGEKSPRIDDNRVESSDDYSLGFTQHFSWVAESGVNSINGADWITKNAVPYLEAAYAVYRDNEMRVGDLTRLPARVAVRASSQCVGGIGGATGDGSLSYCAGEWNSNQFCYGIITHELCNLFTGDCVTAGWPTEWWANHRSPFPTMLANEVMRVLIPKYYRMWGDYNDPLVLMFERLYKTHPGTFSRMFKKMREFGVSLTTYNEPYLSQVVYYFMFFGAQRALGRYFVNPPMPMINIGVLQELESKYNLGVTSLPVE